MNKAIKFEDLALTENLVYREMGYKKNIPDDVTVEITASEDWTFDIDFDVEEKKLDEMLKGMSGLHVNKDALKYTLSLEEKEKEIIKEYAISQAVETIRNRLDQFGLAEPNVAKQGNDKILVELPGIKTAEDEQRARELIAKAAHLQLMAVDEKKRDRANTISLTEAAQNGDVI